MKKSVLTSLVLGFAVVGSSAVIAQDNKQSQNDRSKGTKVRVVEDRMADKEDMGDQSRIICRKTEDTGSRLRARRVCATAAEWAEQRRQNRESIEKTQTQRFGRGGN